MKPKLTVNGMAITSEALEIAGVVLKTKSQVECIRLQAATAKQESRQYREKIITLQQFLQKGFALSKSERNLIYKAMLELFVQNKNALTTAERSLTGI